MGSVEMTRLYLADAETGACLGSVMGRGVEVPDGAVDVGVQPGDGRMVWDFDAEEWRMPDDVMAEDVRAERDRLLEQDVDHINAVRWNSMSATQQQAWAEYRQALLDVPQQAGFPQAVTWPVAPEVNAA